MVAQAGIAARAMEQGGAVLHTMMELVRQALADQHLVQSFSGVRTRFGEDPEILPHHAALASLYGYYYARALKGNGQPLILARDPRPTGPALCQALVQGFLAAGKPELMDLGIITTPLTQSAVRSFRAAGGVIVTASHNPLTDNGWKFLTGVGDGRDGVAPQGALLSARHMAEIVESVGRAAAEGDPEAEAALAKVSREDAYNALLKSGSRRMHNRAAQAYLDTIVNDWGLDVQELRRRRPGPIMLDPNGGAASGLNSGILEDLGVRVYEMNAELSHPVHPIDTDSINPETGEHVLTRVARAVKGCGAQFGVAFDYDADRGNVVLPGSSTDAVVSPQSISALNVALSLARWEVLGRSAQREVWVVASEATSRRVEEIVRLFNAKIAWVETGEVNVVTRIRELLDEGYEVPIGVEGANGGTVFAGSTCRDGVLTALSCSLALSDERAAALLLKRIGYGASSVDGLGTLISALPAWYTPITKVRVKPVPHADVKRIIEETFADQIWPEICGRYSTYRFRNYEGTREVPERTGEETGGWRVEMEGERFRSFIFVRGSRTEAGIWRTSADSSDPKESESLLSVARRLLAAVGLEE